MFLLDDLLLSPGKAALLLFQELARKANEDWLNDDAVKQELQELYSLVDAGRMSEPEFEIRESRLLQRLEQIATAKAQGTRALPAAPVVVPTVVEECAVRAVTEDIRDLENLERVMQWREEKQAIAPPPPSAPAPPPVFVPPQVASIAAPTVERQPVPIAAALTMSQVIDCVYRGLALLRLKVSAVTSIAREEGGWRVAAELVERKAVPDTSDLLGVYELHLDEAGNILRYERTRMRRRSDLGRP